MSDGLCECGCGGKAPIATQTRAKYGHVKGRPVRFIAGHYRGGAPARASLEERFWQRVDKRAPDECWEWIAGRTKAGYGYITAGPRGSQRHVYAHRLSYELAHGPIPDGKHVCHRCDNPPCCNPAHLRLGTHADNMADMKAKGRARGRYSK